MNNSAITEKPWLDNNQKPMVSFKNVSKKYGEFVAIDNLSIDIYPGELFCLLGSSGSGKSTMLRMLAGFENISSGSIAIDGVDIGNTPPYLRPVNMMFQSYALFPHMTAEQNIAFGLKQDKLPKAKITARIDEMLNLVQLKPFAKRKPQQLSGGQQQRVALARALAKRPKLLLLDEPLGALDKKLRESTQFELCNIQEKLGITFIVVTHDQEEALSIGHRIGIMKQGEIAQIGEPRDIYEFPASRFVANFIGQVNIFMGIITTDDNDHAIITCQSDNLSIYVDRGISGTLGQTIWIALRPEKVQVSKQDPEQRHNKVHGQVKDIAYSGSLSTFHIELTSGKIVFVTRTNRERHDEEQITWEDKVWIYWQPKNNVVLPS